MTDPHRRVHTPDADAVREVSDDDPDDGTWRIRMPATSTAEARDGVAFERSKVEGFREQIASERIPVFLDHGRNANSGHRYSAAGRVGYVANPALEERDGVTDLVVDFVLMDPDSMSDGAGWARDALTLIRDQAAAGLPIASSIGWSDDTGDRDLPGGSDLLEVSLVGVGSDPRTTTASADAATMARAVSAASEEFDVETFVRELERAGRNTVAVGGEEIDLTPPDAVQNAATLALAKDDELDTGCGTGAGDQSARQLAGDDVTAERIDDIAAYLTSHEEDVTADGPPSDWSDEEWADCGNIQYAKWGGTGTGTGLEWAQRKANQVADAADEEEPYPNRDMTDRNLDDPEFSEGDPVEWSSNDTTVRGRVADVGGEFSPAEGVTITGEEGEAVYLIHELDDSLEPPQYRRENVAKPESSLDASAADLPSLEGNFADDGENNMSDDTEPDAESGTDPESNRMEMEAMMEQMVDMQEEQTEMLREMYESGMGEKTEGEDGDGDEDDGEDDDMDGENAADADDGEARTVTLDGEERTVDEALATLRSEAADDVAPETPDTRDHADGERDAAEADGEETDDDARGFGLAALE